MHAVLEIKLPRRHVEILALNLQQQDAVNLANAVGEGAFRIVYRYGKYYYGKSWMPLPNGPWELAEELAANYVSSSRFST